MLPPDIYTQEDGVKDTASEVQHLVLQADSGSFQLSIGSGKCYKTREPP